MAEIRAPQKYETRTDEINVFLAGGITDCPRWQDVAVEVLAPLLNVFNPRRDDWPDDPAEVQRQIEWEHYALRLMDAHLFWFAADAIQPIALYELGKVQSMGLPLFVGADPDYPRLQDLQFQLPLVRPSVELRSTLAAVIGDVAEWNAALVRYD